MPDAIAWWRQSWSASNNPSETVSGLQDGDGVGSTTRTVAGEESLHSPEVARPCRDTGESEERLYRQQRQSANAKPQPEPRKARTDGSRQCASAIGWPIREPTRPRGPVHAETMFATTLRSRYQWRSRSISSAASSKKLSDFIAQSPAIHVDPSLWTSADLWEHQETDTYRLNPGQFVLAQTLERVRIPPDLVGLVEGRSSWARVGVTIHVTAPKIGSGL